MRAKGITTRLNLALQGGGAHGAFTWGVLDRLLEDINIEFGWVSATSAGAVNAVALASGLARGGRLKARETLAHVWMAVERAGVPDLSRISPFLANLTKASGLSNMAALMSPYDFNPLGFDPFRRVLEETIDFAAIRQRSKLELLIAATDVATGRPKFFRRHETTVDAVLASACLPMLHHAVEIAGRLYWDGGYSANPDLITIADESPVGDTLLIELNPIEIPERPRSARDIALHVNHVTFNQPLLRDIEHIVAAQETQFGLMAPKTNRTWRLAHHRYHLIEAGPFTRELEPDSKLTPDSKLLSHLYTAGRSEADRWMKTELHHVGRKQTVDFRARYLDRPTRPTLGGLATRSKERVEADEEKARPSPQRITK